ncbi:MAG: Crp/Fnr family transcriptional regulator [Kordiimonadaceae bacterium]|nr:Crp/Fnr family transcriptional regulator [Kordiimonadaceae bacterium]
MLEHLAKFFGDDPQVLADIKSACSTITFKPNATILSQEEEGKTVYCLLEGEAKALLFSEDGDEIWLDEYQPGTLFGEISLLSGENRTADIVAATNVTVAAFHEDAFMKLMYKHGSIGVRMSQMLARRVQKTTRRLFEVSSFSAKGRVYAELLRMAEPNGSGSNKLTIKRLPTFSVFAKKVNSTRETVSRTVNELIRMGYVKREGHCLDIIDPEGVEDLRRW